MPGAPDASNFLPEKSARATGVAIAGGIIIGGASRDRMVATRLVHH
jgi:hypothetical protein